MKNDCEVLQDLYPNYIDGICSEKSKQLVEEHLQECEKCNQIVKDMAREMEEVTVDEDPEEELSKDIMAKVVGKKYFMVFTIALLFFITGLYNIFLWFFSSMVFFTPEQAITGKYSGVNNAEIIRMEEVESNLYAYIYEDGAEYGSGMMKKHIGGLLWTPTEHYRGMFSLGRPFDMNPFRIYNSSRLRVNSLYGYRSSILAVKVNDSSISFIALNLDYDEESTTLEYLRDNDRYQVEEVINGYALFINVTPGIPRAFKEDGTEVPYAHYSYISNGGEHNE